MTLQADIVSPRGRKLTEAVFGEALSPSRVVERICADVQSRGLEALLHYTEQLDGVRLDRASHRAWENGRLLDLTPTEFRLLECFLRHPGRAFSRSQLMDVAIGEHAVVMERTIDVHVKSLRKKLGAAGELLETVRGVGYRFRERPR